MDKQAFIEKIEKENFWDYIVYYKQWKNFETFIVGMDGENGDFGEEQVILATEDSFRYATNEERKKILNLF